MLTEFHFLRPFWLAVIPVVWWLVFRLLGKWRSSGNLEQIVEPHLLEFLLTKHPKQQQRLLPWILCLAGTLLLLALAGPVWEKIPQPLLRKSQARVFVLDLSYSMLATDIKPTRIDRARFKLEDFLKRFVEGETALIAYAGEAFVISPLTHDPATIASLLPSLRPNIMPVPGSRADRAIELAADLLSRGKGGIGHIILVTDGIEGLDHAIVENAVGWNRLSILAVGTESGSPIALSGGGFLKDKNGAIVISKLNPKPLQKLAKKTQGSFAVLSIDDQDVERIISAEDVVADFVEDKQQRTTEKWNEEGPWLLLLALPFCALLFRRGLLFSSGFLLLFGVATMPNPVQAFGWEDLWLRQDQQAAKLFQQGDTKNAAQLFENPEWKGTAAYRDGDYENAIAQFSLQDSPRDNFNRGNSLAFAGRLEEALDAFEHVLAANPQHEDALFNRDLIEKLLKEQQQKQQNNQQKKGKTGERKKTKQDEQEDSSMANDDQNNQHEQKYSVENKDSENQQTSEAQNNNAEKQTVADENEIKDKSEKVDESAEQKIALNENQHLTPEEQSKQQALEQWLRKIPDDPGRLLRNKMRREFQRRGKQQLQYEQYW